MKPHVFAIVAVMTISAALIPAATFAQSTSKQEVVVATVPPNPVTVETSTTTKKSPVGLPVTDFKPKPKVKPAAPPPPPKKK